MVHFVISTICPVVILWAHLGHWGNFWVIKVLAIAWIASTFAFVASVHFLAGVLSARDIELADEIRQLKAEIHKLKADIEGDKP